MIFLVSDFEQEAGYPIQDERFLDLSIRGICTDDQDVQHPVAKELITSKYREKKR